MSNFNGNKRNDREKLEEEGSFLNAMSRKSQNRKELRINEFEGWITDAIGNDFPSLDYNTSYRLEFGKSGWLRIVKTNSVDGSFRIDEIFYGNKKQMLELISQKFTIFIRKLRNVLTNLQNSSDPDVKQVLKLINQCGNMDVNHLKFLLSTNLFSSLNEEKAVSINLLMSNATTWRSFIFEIEKHNTPMPIEYCPISEKNALGTPILNEDGSKRNKLCDGFSYLIGFTGKIKYRVTGFTTYYKVRYQQQISEEFEMLTFENKLLDVGKSVVSDNLKVLSDRASEGYSKNSSIYKSLTYESPETTNRIKSEQSTTPINSLKMSRDKSNKEAECVMDYNLLGLKFEKVLAVLDNISIADYDQFSKSISLPNWELDIVTSNDVKITLAWFSDLSFTQFNDTFQKKFKQMIKELFDEIVTKRYTEIQDDKTALSLGLAKGLFSYTIELTSRKLSQAQCHDYILKLLNCMSVFRVTVNPQESKYIDEVLFNCAMWLKDTFSR